MSTFCKQSCVLAPVSTSRFVNVPEPAGMDPPVSENPRIVVALVEIIKPASVEDPPDAPVILIPSKLSSLTQL